MSDLNILLFKFQDECITVEELGELQSLLKQAEHRAQLVDECYLSSGLADVFKMQASLPAEERPVTPSGRFVMEPKKVSPSPIPAYSSSRIVTWAALAACLMLAFFLSKVFIDGYKPSGEVIAQSTFVSGEGFLERKDLKIKLAPGLKIKEGDRLLTSGDAYLQLTLEDGSRLQLGSNSSLELHLNEPKKKVVLLEKGYLFAEVQKQKGDALFFRTSEAEVEVLGTQFLIESGQNHFQLDLIEGKVAIENRDNGNRSVLKAGELQGIKDGQTLEKQGFGSKYEMKRFQGKIHSIERKTNRVDVFDSKGEKRSFFMVQTKGVEALFLPKSLKVGEQVELFYKPGVINEIDRMREINP